MLMLVGLAVVLVVLVQVMHRLLHGMDLRTTVATDGTVYAQARPVPHGRRFAARRPG